MRIITNSVDPTQVEETEDKYIINDVPFVRPMVLSGGYVPEDSITKTANGWNGRKATLNHPRNENGEPIPAREKPETHIGEIKEPYYDGTHVRGNVHIWKDELDGGEAEDIRVALENENPIDVSSQYAAEELPPGEYDGEYRENVERIIEPDSVAILPNKPGVCSLEDGCGINPEMVANAKVSLTATDDPVETGEDSMESNAEAIDYSGTASGDLDESEIPNDDFESHYVFAGENKSDSSFPLVDSDGNLRAENVAAAFRFRDDAPDQSQLLDVLGEVNGEFDDPPIDPESLEEAMTSNSGLISNIASFLGLAQNSDERAESRSGSDDSNTMKDEDKIDYLAENSEYDRENLEAWDGTNCLTNLYETVQANEETSEEADEPDTSEVEANEVVLTEDELEGMIESKAEEIVANQQEQNEKEALASDIVSNSAEYDDVDSVITDYPTVAALETKKESLDSGSLPAGGVTPNVERNGDEDDFEPVVIE